MTGLVTDSIKTNLLKVVCSCIIFVILQSCSAPITENNIAVGIISSNEYDKTQIWQGFSDGMTKLGYLEGKNLKYIVKKVPEADEQKIDSAIKELLNQNLNLILTVGGDLVDLRVQELSKGSIKPILFSSAPSPVENGLVKDLKHPSGNITGVQVVDCFPKTLEFIKEIIPGAKKIFIPYNRDDQISLKILTEVRRTASHMSVEVFAHEIHSVEEAIAAIENLTKDVDAIFIIPSPTLNPRNNELSNAAIRRRIPMASGLYLDSDVLITFSGDLLGVGKELADIAWKVLKGTKPAEIPVATMDTKLIINLKTAEKIGVQIPNGILAQASEIIR